jgi:hypothetical protein
MRAFIESLACKNIFLIILFGLVNGQLVTSQTWKYAGFPLPLVTDENKTSTGESKTPAIVTLAN